MKWTPLLLLFVAQLAEAEKGRGNHLSFTWPIWVAIIVVAIYHAIKGKK